MQQIGSNHSINSLPLYNYLSVCRKDFLNAASVGLYKVKNIAARVFQDYRPALVLSSFAFAVGTVFKIPMGAIAALSTCVALVSINLSSKLDTIQEKTLGKAISPLDGSKGICAVIKAIALTTLKEIVALTAVCAIAAFFVTSEIGMISLAIGALSSICVNVFFRIISGAVFLTCAEKDLKTHELKMPEGKAKQFIDFVEYIAPISYSFVHCSTADTVIHESGHALAAKVLYNQAEPQIILFPYLGGMTSFIPKTLSRIGNLLGPYKSSMVIAAAGPAAAVGAATAELVLADKFEHTHPRLSRYLKVMGGINIASHLVYAYSAFTEASSAATASHVSGHDFVKLWAGGIHPYTSIISMVAVPIIVKTGIYLSNKK